MTLRLSAMQSRVLAVSLLLLVIAAAVAAVALPTWLVHKHYDAYLEDFTDRLMRYRRVAALRPAIEEGIAAVEARAGRQNYLKGTSPASAAAELQGLATTVIEAHEGRIIGSQALPAKAGAKVAEPGKVAISILMNATINSLPRIVYALETTQPYLFLDQLTVRVGGRINRLVPGAEPEYQVQLTVSGYALAGGGKP